MFDSSIYTTIKGRTSKEENKKDARRRNEQFDFKANKVKKNLGDDIRTLQYAFQMLNELYFKNKLDNSTVINLNPNMRAKKFYVKESNIIKKQDLENETERKKSKKQRREKESLGKQKKFGEKQKQDSSTSQESKVTHKEEDCNEIQLSTQILNMEIDEALMYLLLGMLAMEDLERKNAYYNDSLKDNSKKGTYSPLISRNGTYFSEAFALRCKEVHIHAEPIKNAKGKFDGAFIFTPTDQFREDLRKRRLDKIKFVCSMNGTEKEAPKSKQSTRLLVCPMCGTKIRCTRPEVRVKCCSLEHPTKEVFFEEQKKQ